MANYYLDFVGLNTFIYETCSLEDNNTLGLTTLHSYKNHDFSHNLPTTASFFPALLIKRNGPYGHSTWGQIRSFENPLIRNQKKKNIFSIVTDTKKLSSYTKVSSNPDRYRDESTLEYFRENPVSLEFSPVDIDGQKTGFFNNFKYFSNDRLSNLYSIYRYNDPIETDSKIARKISQHISSNFEDVKQLKFPSRIYPLEKNLDLRKRTRQNYSFPWKDSRSERKIMGHNFTEVGSYTNAVRKSPISQWNLDPSQHFATATSSLTDYFINHQFGTEDFSGILQNKQSHVFELDDFFSRLGCRYGYHFKPLPLYNYKHTITPLTSCVGPYGMNIQGVNDGTLFNGLSLDHIPSGEANWDAPIQYGESPFYNSYEYFVDDIKKVSKDSVAIPEFRSSTHFNDLQEQPQITPDSFLKISGGFTDTTSSIDDNFYEIYSHSDFMKNFDVVLNLPEVVGKDKTLSIKCRGVKKLTPYDGFYPAQRTAEIAKKFVDSLIQNCSYSSSLDTCLGGFTSGDSVSSPVYFRNIMTPMFAPGILFNSIKSGIAVDYPIHTSSLTLANDGINIYQGDYYIRKKFDQRVPFEALVEPAEHLTDIEIHCSEPHPSGNLSGSARWSGVGDTTEYQLMMHNFLAETANFFLQDQNFSFIASESSDSLSVNLQSGSMYVLDISLYRSQNFTSERTTYATDQRGEFEEASLLMTGSGVQETFTMYSRPSAFGPANRVVTEGANSVAVVTASYSNLGYNWAFTPPYYDGISKLGLVFLPSRDGAHTLEEIFNGFFKIQMRVSGMHDQAFMDQDFERFNSGSSYLSDLLEISNFTENHGIPLSSLTNSAGDFNYGIAKESCMHNKASINVNLGILKEVDLLDDGSSDKVQVAVDISSETKSQIIIQPKWETPMLNFDSYTSSSTVTLPLIGSQSVPRGMWHQYGVIETDPNKGIFMQVTDPKTNPILKTFASSFGTDMFNLADMIGMDTSPVKLGRVAGKKVIREAIVAVPFIEYDENRTRVEDRRKFYGLEREEIENALNGNTTDVAPEVADMVKKMQRFVFPPMFNFVEDPAINPVAMYIFEFTHTLDQEDLSAIWQNLPPKIMTNFETKSTSAENSPEVVTISHGFEDNSMLRTITGDIEEDLKRTRWMVFKVKQKAQQNYYDKIVGETKSLNKTSPYSHNWPYDYFSLVELAKLETEVTFTAPPPVPQEDLTEIVTPTQEITLPTIDIFTPQIVNNLVPNESAISQEPEVISNPFTLDKPIAVFEENQTLIEQNIDNFGQIENNDIPIVSNPEAELSDTFVGSITTGLTQQNSLTTPQAQQSETFVGGFVSSPASKILESGILGQTTSIPQAEKSDTFLGGSLSSPSEVDLPTTLVPQISQTNTPVTQIGGVSSAQASPVTNVTDTSGGTPQATLQETPAKKVDTKVTVSIPPGNPLK